MDVLPDPGRSRAVLIGASRFGDPQLPDLPAVLTNIDALAACLRDPNLWGLPADRCVVVSDPDSVVALVDPVHDAAAGAEDTLVVYYAGHGLVHPRTLGLLLAVVGSAPGRTHTAVPYDLVRDTVIDSPAARKVVILDCCYSGRAIGGMADPTTAVADEASIEGTYVIASAPPNKQALSPPGETYTAFTGALLGLLTEGVPDGPPLLALDDIYRRVRESLKRAARPEPQRRASNTAGALALVRNHWHAPDRDLVAGRYQLGEMISGSVRRATDVQTGRTVAVKPLPAGADLDRLRAVAAMSYDYWIVEVLDVVAGPPAYVVTEYNDGPTLADVLRTDAPLNPLWAARIVAHVCSSLMETRKRGVLHGRLDVDSVMLDKNGVIRILNYGLAQALGAEVDVATEVRAAGRLLFELVTGQPAPASGFVPPSSIRPGLPRGIDHVVGIALQPAPGLHYRTIESMHRDLYTHVLTG